MHLLAATLLTTAALTGTALTGVTPSSQNSVKTVRPVQTNCDTTQSSAGELAETLKKCGVIVKKISLCPNNGGSQDSNDSQNNNGGSQGSNDNQNNNGGSQGNNGGVSDSAASNYALRVVELVNAERAKYNLAPLTLDTSLANAADTRAKEIVQSFSHTRPNGESFSTVLKEHGVSYRGSGENIAWGQKTPEIVVNTWMNSEGHRANILNSRFTKIGVGYYVNNNTPYWVQLFTY